MPAKVDDFPVILRVQGKIAYLCFKEDLHVRQVVSSGGLIVEEGRTVGDSLFQVDEIEVTPVQR